MRITVLGATGRTGRLVVAELLRRGHEVVAVVRDAARAPEGVEPVVGDVRDGRVLARAVEGAGAVVSALGTTRGESHLHATLAPALVTAMDDAGVRRVVGVSGAGVDAPGDRKRARDKVISTVMATLGRAMIGDRTEELGTLSASDLEWTLVRPPRLADGPATGDVEHDAHVSTRSTSMARADLAAFVADVLEQGWYVRQAPFAASRRAAPARTHP